MRPRLRLRFTLETSATATLETTEYIGQLLAITCALSSPSLHSPHGARVAHDDQRATGVYDVCEGTWYYCLSCAGVSPYQSILSRSTANQGRRRHRPRPVVLRGRRRERVRGAC